MAKNEMRPLGLKILAEDTDVFDALKGIANYAPADEKRSIDGLQKLRDIMLELHTQKTLALATLKAVSDNLTAAEWNFHNGVLSAKDLVRGQFGKNSNEVQALGMKKSSEYKRPKRKTAETKKVA